MKRGLKSLKKLSKKSKKILEGGDKISYDII